jgi:hypothetical protein
MLILKFFALLGALMGIYAAAALQNGPEVADANLCKLARRISSSVSDQCIPSLDDYGTAVAVIFCVLEIAEKNFVLTITSETPATLATSP